MKITSFLILIFSALFMLNACNNKSTKNDSITESEEISENDHPIAKEAKTCDEFIDQYEEWMNDYLDFLEKYINDPLNSELSSEYMKLAQEGMSWMSQWTTKFYYCASKEEYQKRFDEISEKADKKVKELGID